MPEIILKSTIYKGRNIKSVPSSFLLSTTFEDEKVNKYIKDNYLLLKKEMEENSKL